MTPALDTAASRGVACLTVDLRLLWAVGWVAWLITGALAPLPPWSAAATLAGEAAAARRLASQPERVGLWSIELGSERQRGALTRGFTPNAFAPVTFGRSEDGRRYAVAPAGEVEIAFTAPGWERARLLIWQRSRRDAEVRVAIDGREVGIVTAASAAWGPAALPAGRLEPGIHRITLASPVELWLRAVAAGDEERVAEWAGRSDAPGDCGYAGFTRVGLDDRPALFVCGASSPVAGARELPGDGPVRTFFGFEQGRGSSPWRTAMAGANGLLGVALALLLPGLAWTRRRGLSGLAVALGVSTVVLIASLLLLRIVGVAPDALPLAACLAAAGGLGLGRLTTEERRLRLPCPELLLGACVLAALCVFAARVVPPLDDQDLEVQATAASLARRLVPLTVTDRGTTYFFAHPPLLHLWVAASFSLSGRLERVADASQLAVLAQREAPFRRPGADEYPPPYLGQWLRLLGRFYEEPQLWPTRQVNVLLGALAAAGLAHLVRFASGSTALGLLSGALLASFPEFLVRASYGGYFAGTTLLSLAILAGRAGTAERTAAAGLAALSDQKGLLVPLAWALAGGRGLRRIAPLAGGLAGIALFAVWGLAVHAPTFVYDFAQVHVTQRLALDDVRFVADPALWYPSIPELWREFARNYGLLFTIAGGAAALLGLRRGAPETRVAAVAVLIGAVVFSLTDWRQTKHLAQLAPLAILLLADAFAASPGRLRLGLALLLAMIAQNLWLAARLLSDFEALRPSTIW